MNAVAAGVALDFVLGDQSRLHPVAGFGAVDRDDVVEARRIVPALAGRDPDLLDRAGVAVRGAKETRVLLRALAEVLAGR